MFTAKLHPYFKNSNKNIYPHQLLNDQAHLINIKVLNNRVEAGVQVIEQVNDLQGRGLCRQLCEANDVTEVDCDLVVGLRHDRLAHYQLGGYGPGEEIVMM